MRLLAIGLALASIATAMSAFASSLYLAAALRLLVGVGQRVLVPAAYSLLGDIVPRARLGRAVAGFAIGPFLGAGLILVLGGPAPNVTHRSRADARTVGNERATTCISQWAP